MKEVLLELERRLKNMGAAPGWFRHNAKRIVSFRTHLQVGERKNECF